MSANLAPPPLQTPLVESPRTGMITRAWFNWFLGVLTRVQGAATAIPSAAVELTGQTASIGVTSLMPNAPAGLYRVSWRFRVTTAAGVASSLTVSIHSTDDAVACQQDSVAYAGNVTTRPQSGSVLVWADPGSVLSYSTTYTSNPAAAMVYDLALYLEQL
jgi:hypothetical protein